MHGKARILHSGLCLDLSVCLCMQDLLCVFQDFHVYVVKSALHRVCVCVFRCVCVSVTVFNSVLVCVAVSLFFSYIHGLVFSCRSQCTRPCA